MPIARYLYNFIVDYTGLPNNATTTREKRNSLNEGSSNNIAV